MILHHRCLPCCGGHVRRWRVCGPWNRAAQPHGFLELKFVGIERVEGRSDVVVVLAPVAAEAWMCVLGHGERSQRCAVDDKIHPITEDDAAEARATRLPCHRGQAICGDAGLSF